MSCHLIETANAAATVVAPGATLPEAARRALIAALEDETAAVAECAARVAAFGEVAPFASHLKAKRRRVAALATMAKAYGLPVPKAPLRADGARRDAQDAGPATGLEATREAACVAGIAAETLRLARYDAAVPDMEAAAPELARVFAALGARTRDRHLPALRRALTGASGIPDLRGSGFRHGASHAASHGAHHRHSHGGCGHHRCGQAQAEGH